MRMKNKFLLIIVYAIILCTIYSMYTKEHSVQEYIEPAIRRMKHFDDSFPPDLPKNLTAFDPRMTSLEKDMLLDVMNTFDKKMTELSLIYHLYGGSLLGLYRHGGIIPWDDDIDVWINNSQSDLFKKEFAKLEGFSLFSPRNDTWKFYSVGGTSITGVDYKWPFVDIFQFGENKTHTWDISSQYKELFVYKKTDVYPLKKCRFEKLLLNVPKNLEKVVTTNYDPEICATNRFDHKINQPIQQQRHALPCKHLNQYFKFHKPSCRDDSPIK